MAVRIRNLARALAVDEEALVLWLIDNAPGLKDPHPAAFVPGDVAAAARRALGPAEDTRPVVRRCEDCAEIDAPAGARVVEIEDSRRCERCAGSVNRREALALVEAFRDKGLGRLLVVGGSPGTAGELRDLVGGALDLRIIEGNAHHDSNQAETELRWADVVAIWGATILDHKVSKLFTDRRGAYRDKLVSLSRRSVGALCRAVADKARAR